MIYVILLVKDINLKNLMSINISKTSSKLPNAGKVADIMSGI